MRWIWLLLTCWVVLCGGCARNAAPSYESAPASAPPPPPRPAPMAGMQAFDAAPVREESLEAAPAAAPPEGGGSAIQGQPEGKPAQTSSSTTDSSPARAQRRMVHYNGYAQLRVTRVSEALDAVAAQAAAVGGFTERLSGSSITVRVPVDQFKSSFAGMLKLGDVLSRSVSAEDITDAYQSVSLRLKTAETTRERLLELLARARTEQEKIQLLREIQRVTEEIDSLQSMVKTLSSLASFSRITIQVTPREAMSGNARVEEVGAFRWIQSLSPFRREVASRGKSLRLNPPNGMVELKDKGDWQAESADGARIWASKQKNQPRGDSAFWLEALRSRLEPEFASARVETVGAYQVLQLTDRAEDPYQYWIALRTDGKFLELVEVYFPASAHVTRYGSAVRASLQGGAR